MNYFGTCIVLGYNITNLNQFIMSSYFPFSHITPPVFCGPRSQERDIHDYLEDWYVSRNDNNDTNELQDDSISELYY